MKTTCAVLFGIMTALVARSAQDRPARPERPAAPQPIDVATRQALLDVTARIGSDHERGRVMSAMLREGVLR